MIGIIHAFSGTVSMGYIHGSDGHEYKFMKNEWLAQGSPASGLNVTFEARRDTAYQVNLLQAPMNKRARERFVGGL